MANNYDFGAINNRLEGAVNCAESVSNHCKNINDGFINGMQNIWNARTGYEYVKNVSEKLNDFITQFNQKFPKSITDVVNDANSFLNTQDREFQNPINNPDIPPIGSLEINWMAKQPLEPGYRIPEEGDIPNIYNEHLKNNIDKITSLLNEYASALKTTVNTELNGDFCVAVSDAVKELVESAKEVITAYGNKASSDAADNETIISSHKR